MKELCRVTCLDILNFPEANNIIPFVVRKNVLDNPNAIRFDDPITGDIIFYEQSKDGEGMKKRKPIHDNWSTPVWLIEQIRNEFGEFFDPCPLNAGFDGLSCEWGKVNYINPPYSRKLKEQFIRKAFEESKKGKLCVMLLPVSTSTKVFHEIILPNAEIRFLKGRVNFEGINTFGENVSNRVGMHDSMIVVFRARLVRE